MNAVRRSLNACFVQMFCSAVRWTLFGVQWTVFGVRRCCRLCFVRLSSDDPCSVRSFVRQGWAPLVLFFVLFGKLCFVRSYVEFPFMQGLFGSGLCSAYLALFSLLLPRPVLFCILFGHVCFASSCVCSSFCSGRRVLFGVQFGDYERFDSCWAFCSEMRF